MNKREIEYLKELADTKIELLSTISNLSSKAVELHENVEQRDTMISKYSQHLEESEEIIKNLKNLLSEKDQMLSQMIEETKDKASSDDNPKQEINRDLYRPELKLSLKKD